MHTQPHDLLTAVTENAFDAYTANLDSIKIDIQDDCLKEWFGDELKGTLDLEALVDTAYNVSYDGLEEPEYLEAVMDAIKKVLKVWTDNIAESLDDYDYWDELIYYADCLQYYDNNTYDCEQAFLDFGYDLGSFDNILSAIKTAANAGYIAEQMEYVEELKQKLDDLL